MELPKEKIEISVTGEQAREIATTTVGRPQDKPAKLLAFMGKDNAWHFFGKDDNEAVIGFDTAHVNGERMTANDVREECFNLIEQIESLKEKRYCNQCGAQVEPDFNFCEICGQKLAKESEE